MTQEDYTTATDLTKARCAFFCLNMSTDRNIELIKTALQEYIRMKEEEINVRGMGE